MNKIKKIGFIILLILFIIGFPLIGLYESNRIQGTNIYPSMEAALAKMAWRARGAVGAWILIVIKLIKTLKISKGTKYFSIFLAAAINIWFMLLPSALYMGYQYMSILLIIANLLILLPIGIDKYVNEKTSEEKG